MIVVVLVSGTMVVLVLVLANVDGNADFHHDLYQGHDLPYGSRLEAVSVLHEVVGVPHILALLRNNSYRPKY